MSYYPPSTVIPIYSVFMGVAVALTGLRLWVRLSYARIPLGIDDYSLLFGLTIAITCNGIQYYNALKGTGGEAIKDPNEMTQMVIISHQIDWAMIVIEKAGFGAIKLSILFFYRRIFGVWDSFRRVNNALLWIVFVWAVVFTLADVLICGAHPELIWGFDQTIALHRCGNRGALLLAFSVTSVATDLPVLGLPFFYISRLQMSTSRKWATSLVFFIGTVSTGASILRLIFLIVSYPVGRLNFAYTPPPDDQTPLVLKVFNPTFWALAELWLGVWAANLPPCAPLLRNVNFRPYRILSGAYRRTWTWRSSTAVGSAASSAEKKGRGNGKGVPLSEASRGSGRKGSNADDLLLMTQDSVPLVSMSRHERTPSEPISISDVPPSLAPVGVTGTGRLSVFGRLLSTESTEPERA
ncbi:hypothetical protein GGR51DRAFT_156853 [Nemania sp. FL0031]|nr:hypothetical protein GGR51DRAFT_156853 [Nemania sp. FL0031]